jgi:large subunit ribosomal protein L20
MTYNRFISGLRQAGIQVDRKVLADIAVTDPRAFASLVSSAREGLSGAGGSTGSTGKA